MTDRSDKRRRVHGILAARGAGSIALRSHAAVSWYLDGARTHVPLAGDPVIAVVVRPDGDEVRVFAQEADRLVAEELPADAVDEVRTVRWDRPLLPAGSAELDENDALAELRAARAALLPGELARYRALCREVAEVLTDVARTTHPTDTEHAVAARLAAALVERGIDPIVLLVAGDARAGHRHPLPTSAPLGTRAMLTVGARRAGLIANATRWVRLGTVDAALDDRAARLLEVEAAFLGASTEGARIGDAFGAGVAAYAAHGFDPEEWTRHHQGGAAGYSGRDPRGAFDVDDRVQAPHAFAWNPTAHAVKVEDTVLVTPHGVEVLTVDARWPTRRVGALERPAELTD